MIKVYEQLSTYIFSQLKFTMKYKGARGPSMTVWQYGPQNTARKRLGEAYPRGIGLWGSLIQETKKKYMCISHATLRMIKASALQAFAMKLKIKNLS